MAKIIIYFSYFFLALFSIFMLVIFRPFKIVDHSKSKLICNKNGAPYEFGPNLIFTIDDMKLDPQTDKNMRKLCEFSIINDFQDTYPTPANINYSLGIVNKTDGSWGDVLLLSISSFTLGILFIEFCKKKFTVNIKIKVPLIVFILGMAIVASIFIFGNFTQKVYCNRIMASNLANFNKSAYGFGLTRLQQEEPRLQSVINDALSICLSQ